MRMNFPAWSSEMNRLRSELDDLFRSRSTPAAFQPSRGYPPLNLWEDDDNLYVESELPGIELDDLDLFVNDDNQLTLQGERKVPGGDGGTRHRQERRFGAFSRIVELPVLVDSDQAAAEMTDGVLRITLPKKEESKPRRIRVKAS